ncbi:MAG: non-ribosomal peptide synthetase, partial [Planctomycetaceae bacterium]
AADVCVHRLFEAQVERTPDAIAVVSEDQALTYRQFNARANQLAHELRARGVVPGRLVAIGLPRSLDLAVGLLGILKAGGAFVPLDPAYPSERLECMLKDARAHLLLTQSQWRGRWPAHAGETICLDAIREAVGRHPAEDLDGGATSEEAAYVIYTSGSTGEPRGVVVRHRGLVNHNRAVAELFGLLPDDRVLQFSSLSFDIAVEEMFPTWLRGAAVVFRDEDYLLHPSEFSNWIQRERITALDLPTAYWHAWVGGLARLGEPLPGSLRLVVVGGEKASARSFADWRSIGGDRIRWINTYGPTEATIVATAYEPPRAGETGEPLTELPIGRPIANTQIYLLDSRLEPVPVGLPGALYIGGEGLARGYLRRPALTAERFIPDPFGDVPGARLFRTGDLARWRTDGNLEFLGRLDQQVKVRGFRVEPGEVESALRRQPSVLEAVVEAYEATPGDKRLVAYVVPRSEAEDGVAELRRGLQATLPDYMVPATFVMLEAMPLSSSGKIDRKALPAPDLGTLDRGAKYVAPRGPTEESLAQVWAEVLGLERVGVLDNFFDLGGHSLQAVQLVARITALLNRPVSVKAIFQAPTVAAMAEDLDREAAEAARVHRDGVATTTPVRSPHARRSVEIPRHLTVEERPLLSLFITGKLAPVESVALGYLPSSLLQVEGLSPEIIIHRLCGDMPTVTGFRETRLGRIAAIMIPRFDYQLYQDRRDLLEVLGDAVRIAQQLGARTVSLTGLLPSATDYGRALAEALAGEDLPGLTTGHATTTSAVVLAIRRALEDGGRSLAEERVGFVGLGSVGSATLQLMLSCLPHPAELILCDVYQKQEVLRALRAEVVDELGYRGRVRLVEARADVPAPVYQASLIVGATNVPDILDIGRLAPGTILVDDSAPHLFRSDEALWRLQECGDILATEGGVLSAPEILPTTVHVPAALDLGLKAELLSLLALSEPRYITGCVLSGLLSARFDHLPPTLGLIDRRTALQHYETLDELGFEAARLHLGETALDERIVREFRARHGGRGRTAAGRSSPLVAIQPDGTRPPLFFVHPIGGNVVCYHELARQLGEDQPFYGIQAAGLEGEAEPEARLEIMAARYIEAMRGVRPDGPYCLGGWSLGGVVAFEMARQLRGQGQEVARLFLIDSRAPSPGASRGRLGDRAIQAAFLLELVRGYGEQIRLPFEVGPGTDPEERIGEFAGRGEVEPWLAAEFGPDRARRLVAVFKANLLALEGYTPGADPGRLVLLVADETGSGRPVDPTLGW